MVTLTIVQSIGNLRMVAQRQAESCCCRDTSQKLYGLTTLSPSFAYRFDQWVSAWGLALSLLGQEWIIMLNYKRYLDH